jgi:hypothetical protein
MKFVRSSMIDGLYGRVCRPRRAAERPRDE